MATTIMISTSVKPDCRVTFVLMLLSLSSKAVWTSSRRIINECKSSTYCPLQPQSRFGASWMPNDNLLNFSIGASPQNEARPGCFPGLVKVFRLYALYVKPPGSGRQNVQVRRGRQRARWSDGNPVDAVGAIRGAFRPVAGRATAKVRREAARGWGSVSRGLVILQRPLLFGAVNLAQVVNASVFLGGRAGAHKVGNRDGGQKTNDGHYDHDFHQGEPGFIRLIDSHTSSFCLSVVTAWAQQQAGLTMADLPTDCLLQPSNLN
jgi:hypothetical protein